MAENRDRQYFNARARYAARLHSLKTPWPNILDAIQKHEFNLDFHPENALQFFETIDHIPEAKSVPLTFDEARARYAVALLSCGVHAADILGMLTLLDYSPDSNPQLADNFTKLVTKIDPGIY